MRLRCLRLLWLALLLSGVLSTTCACEGCRTPATQTPESGAGNDPAAASGPATARLYLISDMAGALEPCGCVKDQLGGMDHFGALVDKEKDKAKASVTLSAGPLFFMDPEATGEKKAQELLKAETIAASMKAVGLAALAPSRNEWAAGAAELAKLGGASAAPILAGNLAVDGNALKLAPWTVKDVGGLRLGIIGVADPDKPFEGAGPSSRGVEGVTAKPAAETVREGIAALKKEGVHAIIALAAVGRGEAKRLADQNPELLAVVVGSTGSRGDVNTKAPPAERVGDVLVIETANHLQTVAVLDFHMRDLPKASPGAPLAKIADGTGIERTRKREEVVSRIAELRAKIATWEKDKTIDPKDIDARRADVVKLEAERDALDKAPPPSTGSFYTYAMREMRDGLGADEAVKNEMLAYYKKVNDANKVAFADKKPEPAPKGTPRFVGVEACSNCHEDARKVWDKTAHAHAYATLSKQFKEFNLDCVSCHVTGYDKPGGSTVTHVAELKDVQCEVCHGPGSLHSLKPETVPMPIAKPGPQACLACHHPPHVHTFDAKAKMEDILGPGHGKKL